MMIVMFYGMCGGASYSGPRMIV